jgi:hypothetical protein
MAGMQESDGDVQNRIRMLEEAVAVIRTLAEVADRKKQEREARSIFNQCKQSLNNFRRDVNKIEDATQKSVYMRKATTYNDKLNAYDKEMKNLIRPVGKRVQSGEEKAMQGIMGDAGDMTDSAKVMNAAVRAQDDNLAILRRIEGTVATTEEMGNEIATKLAADTEKITDINKELNTLQANLDRAKGEVEWFARQMATDKCFLFIMVFVILGICLLVFWKIYKSKHSGGSPATPPPTRADGGSTIVVVGPPAATAAPTTAAAHTTTTSTAAAAATPSPTTTTSAPLLPPPNTTSTLTKAEVVSKAVNLLMQVAFS